MVTHLIWTMKKHWHFISRWNRNHIIWRISFFISCIFHNSTF
ncbi:hypothetical protein X975_02303, partial [Stegodyphus mimosarum]